MPTPRATAAFRFGHTLLSGTIEYVEKVEQNAKIAMEMDQLGSLSSFYHRACSHCELRRTKQAPLRENFFNSTLLFGTNAVDEIVLAATVQARSRKTSNTIALRIREIMGDPEINPRFGKGTVEMYLKKFNQRISCIFRHGTLDPP